MTLFRVIWSCSHTFVLLFIARRRRKKKKKKRKIRKIKGKNERTRNVIRSAEAYRDQLAYVPACKRLPTWSRACNRITGATMAAEMEMKKGDGPATRTSWIYRVTYQHTHTHTHTQCRKHDVSAAQPHCSHTLLHNIYYTCVTLYASVCTRVYVFVARV